ncbi:hypothetical protein CVT24_001698 [Panaeolus cyanescens]|uniref:DUF6534 domain-containing protein n=1 Tax=Panaeolus cyanescens TaxID=181874 RepID=A0A409YFM0_9AGAR|nr:hypothetical protein CVT24_001698 [Panaeolus cyanescens]
MNIDTSFDRNATLGALTIGVLFSSVLFGVVIVQMYLYFTTFPRDHRLLKGLVTSVMIMETAHLANMIHVLYTFNIMEYGDPAELGGPAPLSLFIAMILSVIIGTAVQTFFAYRIKLVSGKWGITIVCWLMTVVRMGTCLALIVRGFQLPNLYEFAHEDDTKSLATSMLSISAGCDIVITGTLCFYLRSQRSDAMKRTARTIDSIIAWSIPTGLANGVAEVTLAICFVCMPTNFIWLGVFTIVARVYSNSLLASLNTCSVVRAHHLSTITQTIGNEAYESSSEDIVSNPQVKAAMRIKMTTLTEVSTDGAFDGRNKSKTSA